VTGDGVEQLSAEVSRVTDRLRTLGHARLARPLGPAAQAGGGSSGSVGATGPPGWQASPGPSVAPDPSVAPGVRSPKAPDQVGRSVADAARDLAQQLADLAADAEARPRRPVPRLGDHAVGDQVAVTGNDLVTLARAGELDLDRQDRAVELLRDLRLALP
jgi:hypothetical protein